jgi:hypothetical protein
MKKYIVTSLAALLAGGTFAGIVYQEGFEEPIVPITGSDDYIRWTTTSNVSFETSDWDVTNVDLFTDDPSGATYRGEAKEGDQFIDLSCSERGIMTKTVSLDAGTYQMSFWMAGNFFDENTGDKQITVSMDLALDTDPVAFSGFMDGQSTLVTADDWVFVESAVFTVSQTQDFTFTLDDTSPVNGDQWAGAFVDDIQIVAVPEPATIALMGIASLGLFLRRRFARF